MTDDFAPDVVLRRAPDALWRRLIAGVLVLGPDRPDPIQVSTPGDLVWFLLTDPITVAELVSELALHYEVSTTQVETDIKPVLRALLDVGALSRLSTK